MTNSDDNPCYIHAEAARDKICVYKTIVTRQTYQVYMCGYQSDEPSLNYCAPTSCPLTRGKG
jgi:hypothetical protein